MPPTSTYSLDERITLAARIVGFRDPEAVAAMCDRRLIAEDGVESEVARLALKYPEMLAGSHP